MEKQIKEVMREVENLGYIVKVSNHSQDGVVICYALKSNGAYSLRGNRILKEKFEKRGMRCIIDNSAYLYEED